MDTLPLMSILAKITDLTYINQTTLSIGGLTVLTPLCLCMLLVPRRYAVAPLVIVVCVISTAQRITLIGADFDSLRILIVFGYLRVITRGEFRGVRWSAMDLLFGGYLISGFVIYAIQRRWMLDALVFRAGEMFTISGIYFQSRCWLRSMDDAIGLAKIMMILAIPTSAFFAVEWATGKNMFSVFGGVPAITVVREGRLRCQGPFNHPILAGCFWAGSLPLVASLWWSGRGSKMTAILATFCAFLIAAASSSSTPAAVVLIVGVAATSYYFRKSLPAIGLLVFLALLVKHFGGNTPAWHLISRIDLVGGSTGDHRYRLIDAAINNFSEWWFVGTLSTAHWGWGLRDCTNHYLLEGVRGGFLTMLFFVAMLFVGFWNVRRGMKVYAGNAPLQKIIWGYGCALCGHCAAFFAVAYFGPMLVIYWTTLATTEVFKVAQFAPHEEYWIVETEELLVEDLTEAPVAVAGPGV